MTIYYQTDRLTLHIGDALEALKQLPSNSVQTAITSPPYFNLCNYNVTGQMGLEETIPEYLSNLTAVFSEVRRILVNGGVFWVVIGDTVNNYSPIRGKGERRSPSFTIRRPRQKGYREKEQLGIPAKLIESMRSDGWMFRRELIWDKGESGAIANSDTAPLTHESILQFCKWEGNGRPYLNCKAMRSSVLRYPAVSHQIHPCPFPAQLARELLNASQKDSETVLDPFSGSGVSLFIGQERGRAIGVELNPEFCQVIREHDRASHLVGMGATEQLSLMESAIA